jgi:hypothetical protein
MSAHVIMVAGKAAATTGEPGEYQSRRLPAGVDARDYGHVGRQPDAEQDPPPPIDLPHSQQPNAGIQHNWVGVRARCVISHDECRRARIGN